MDPPSRRAALLLCALILFTWPACARPQALLKLKGETAASLVAKSLQADVGVQGQFATTRLLLTYLNRAGSRIEAEFHYAAPPGAVVTGFAYWYGDEKVVARVVEKQRAAAIYRAITTRQRDPALVELIGRNMLHARIFPVMPNADLKVEIRYVQPLPSTADGALCTVPLRMAGDDRLDRAAIRVRVARSGQVDAVTNNLGLPVHDAADGWDLALDAANYRPQADLRVLQKRKPAPLSVSLFAAPSGGSDGYFALSVTPGQVVRRPRIAVRGVQTYDVLPARLPDGGPARAIVVVGRYRGAGPATVELTGSGSVRLTAPVRFGSERRPQNLAAKLWAAERIAQLSAGGGHRAEVAALSLAHTIPSPYTSWLAIPTEERERFRLIMAQADADRIAQRLAQLIAERRAGTEEARRGRKRLEELSGELGMHAADLLSAAVRGRAYILAEQISAEAHRRSPNRVRLARLREGLRYLCKHSGASYEAMVAGAGRAWLYAEEGRTAESLARLIVAHRADSPAAARLRARLIALSWRTKQDAADALYWPLHGAAERLAEQIVFERHRAAPDLARISAWRRHLDYICAHSRIGPARGFVDDAECPWRCREEQRIRQRLIEEFDHDQRDEAAIARLKAEWLAVWPSDGEWRQQYVRDRFERLEARGDMARLQRAIDAAEPGQAEALKRRYEAAEKREAELRARVGDPLLKVEAPADALSVTALMPDGTVRPLLYDAAFGRWLARFDIPTYAREGAYVVTVIVVLKDGTRSVVKITYHVDVTPPRGSGSVSLATEPGPVLRLEVEADADTARVEAVLPWGEVVALRSSQPGRFFALAPVPDAQRGGGGPVTYVLTDRAHNRTTFSVDPRP